MKQDMSDIFETIKRFFWRYHLTIFIAVAVGGIGFAILSLLGVVTLSNNTSEYTTTSGNDFDHETIERVKKLNDKPDYTFSLPSDKRNNPFSE